MMQLTKEFLFVHYWVDTTLWDDARLSHFLHCKEFFFFSQLNFPYLSKAASSNDVLKVEVVLVVLYKQKLNVNLPERKMHASLSYILSNFHSNNHMHSRSGRSSPFCLTKYVWSNNWKRPGYKNDAAMKSFFIFYPDFTLTAFKREFCLSEGNNA